VVSSGAVSEFEQPARLSARSAPRGRRVRMASSPNSRKMERISAERVGAAATRRVSAPGRVCFCRLAVGLRYGVVQRSSRWIGEPAAPAVRRGRLVPELPRVRRGMPHLPRQIQPCITRHRGHHSGCQRREVVRRQLGHSTPMITVQIYGAFVPTGEDRAWTEHVTQAEERGEGLDSLAKQRDEGHGPFDWAPGGVVLFHNSRLKSHRPSDSRCHTCT
jgi:hypothetical protein